MRRKTLTLLEVILASTLAVVCLFLLVPLTNFYIKMKQQVIETSPVRDTATTLETAFQKLFRAVNISDKNVVEMPDSYTLIWKTQGGILQRLKFNPQDKVLYFDDNYNPSEEKDKYTGYPILSGVEGVLFYVEPQGRVIIELRKNYLSKEKGKDVIKTLAMRTAIRPYTIQSLDVGRKDVWIDISPLVEGKLLRLEEKNGKLFAVVEGKQVAIHTKDGFLDAKGEIFYVEIPSFLKEDIEKNIGKLVVFNGDILPYKDGWYMKMNFSYAGGMILDEKEIAELHRRIEEGKELWYTKAGEYLKGAFNAAKNLGKDFKGDWRKVWQWLREYYYEKLASLKAKGVK